jgi:phosphatidylglycerol:prolipoprotein diacylglycerol transferase
VYPVLFELGPLTVHSFGALMALGFFVAASLSAKEYVRRGGDGEQMWNLLLYVFIGGLVGSKVLSLGNDIPAFFSSPMHQLTSGSGFVWYGGLIGGFATAFVLHRRYDIPFPTILECTALGLPIGQAIGRLGCHVAGDGDWGIVTTVPWGVAYVNAVIGWDYPDGVLVHPTPLYEAAAYTAVFSLVYALRKRDYPPPTLFALYLVGASTARFFVEFIRINPKVAFGLTQAQLIAVVLAALGVAMLLRVSARHPQMQKI